MDYNFILMVLFRLTLLIAVLSGCVSKSPQPPPESSFTTAMTKTPPLRSGEAEGNSVTANVEEGSNQERLARLWQKRTQESGARDYPIGPGDLLDVNVTNVAELKDRVVRVSGDGTISLPLIGVVPASGGTEETLREEIHHRLETYMHKPRVNLFVREYRSRQVAVVGAVQKPGLYNLASGTDTILDMLSLAGGATAESAARIQFIPAEPVDKHHAKELASTLPVQLSGGDTPLILKSVDPVSIDLKSVSVGGSQKYLSLPARPGDVIIVPGSGEVLVEGWVTKPGSYKITAGLTVLGAVAAAGGSHFAADTSTVTLIRTGKDGERTSLLADLEKIKRRESSDIPVQEGDVVEVSSSTSKLVPYGVYFFFSNVFRVGAAF
jgi:polysaccharide biosynthesis/export protein